MIPTNIVPLPKATLVSSLESKSDPELAFSIVEAFSRRAKTSGIRDISMADLASDLRMSTKTLYKVFANKRELVQELVIRWEMRIRKPIEKYKGDLLTVLRYWVKVWVDNDAQFSTQFWVDLKSDFPDLYQVYVSSLYNRMGAMKERLSPYLKSDVNAEFAWSSYFILMTASAQAKTYEKIGMTKEQCVFAAFDFWMRAAIDMESLAKGSDTNIQAI
ncbi:MAG: TetR/AcrR family transcriptional regulator [Pseudohongiellaceae bacterium]|nr:TetR/AcrR family transcriptional regulator [Pseudohongiellaceae bacterium]